LLSLWLNGADAWMGAVHGMSFAELQREQIRMIHEFAAQVIQAWRTAWMPSLPARQPSITERMAALSLRVVVGGRR
jgi:hypothetical protein